MDTTGCSSLRVFIFKHENFPGWQPSPTGLQWAASLGIKWCEVPSSAANWLQLWRESSSPSPTSSDLCSLALLMPFYFSTVSNLSCSAHIHIPSSSQARPGTVSRRISTGLLPSHWEEVAIKRVDEGDPAPVGRRRQTLQETEWM